MSEPIPDTVTINGREEDLAKMREMAGVTQVTDEPEFVKGMAIAIISLVDALRAEREHRMTDRAIITLQQQRINDVAFLAIEAQGRARNADTAAVLAADVINAISGGEPTPVQ